MRVPTILFPLCAVVVLSFAFGCSGEKQEQAVTPDTTQVSKPFVAKSLGNPEDELARKAAQSLIQQFKTRLRSELMAAIKQSGPEGAIEICSRKAPEIAQELSVGGWAIRRASILNRNPKNYPEGPEGEMIRRFEADTSKSTQATWDYTNLIKQYRYFEAIRLEGMCTSCHGKSEEMDPAVVAKLQQLYPSDRAVGFKVGDLRGIFSVSAVWPKGKAQAAKLAQSAGN